MIGRPPLPASTLGEIELGDHDSSATRPEPNIVQVELVPAKGRNIIALGYFFCGLLFFSSEMVANVAILPSRPSFPTRGRQPSVAGPLALLNSKTYTSRPWIATPVGDKGLSAFNTVSTWPFGVILMVQ